MGQTYNGILFSLRKEGNFDTCYRMEVLEAIIIGFKQLQRDKYCIILLYFRYLE